VGKISPVRLRKNKITNAIGIDQTTRFAISSTGLTSWIALSNSGRKPHIKFADRANIRPFLRLLSVLVEVISGSGLLKMGLHEFIIY